MKTITTHLMADTANGLQVIDPVDYPEAAYLTYAEFKSAIRELDDNDQAFFASGPDEYAELDEEYGISA